MTYENSDYPYSVTFKFIDQHRSNYLHLLEIIKQYLKALFTGDSAGMEAVYRIYSREESPGQIGEIKSILSLTEKIKRNKYKQLDGRLFGINDIVACRVIVYYRYQIQFVTQKIRETANRFELKIEEDEYRNQNGYHAHHLVLSSAHHDLQNLRCELQVKTVLHDAWAAKTHGFTYKPRSQLSPFDINMMQSFGDGVEALEAQSELLRLRWTQERETLKLRQKARIAYAARKAMLRNFDPPQSNKLELTKIFDEVYKNIIRCMAYLSDCSLDDPDLVSILGSIEKIRSQQNGIEFAFKLLTLTASIRNKGDLNKDAEKYLEEWIEFTRKEKAEATYWRSSVYYLIGEIEAAILTIREYLLNQPCIDKWNWAVQFNLLNYICQSEMVQPSDEHSKRKEECEVLISDLELNNINKEDINYSAAQDTLGAYLIAFGNTEEEIYLGITTCQNAYRNSSDDESGIVFRMLHERIGWTKLLSMESIESHLPTFVSHTRASRDVDQGEGSAT